MQEWSASERGVTLSNGGGGGPRIAYICVALQLNLGTEIVLTCSNIPCKFVKFRNQAFDVRRRRPVQFLVQCLDSVGRYLHGIRQSPDFSYHPLTFPINQID